MSALTLCLIIFGAMLVLMAIRVPIAVSMFSCLLYTSDAADE